ncbi:cysteinyl leukotriene receptor 1-like [Babylonia areolata]|uniref:cysteinyl leukotriene receptor 1-like n=1 Tax=Babylonia areolata TaxID=304850 RepID=UPI003FD0E947
MLEQEALYVTAVRVWQVCGPVVLALGTVGNVLSVVVLQTLPGDAVLASVTVYMTALALSDTLLLYSGLLRRSLQYGLHLDIRLLHDVLCKLDIFLVYLSAMTSSWFLVAMTMQRAVSGMCPHRHAVLGTRRKAQLTVMLIVIVLAVINAHFLVAPSLHTDPVTSLLTCGINGSERSLQYYITFVFPWIDMTLTSALPSVLLLVTNTGLAFTLVQSSRRLNDHAANTPGSNSATRRTKAASALTLKLICVSVTFLCLTLPVLTVILINIYDTGDDNDVSAQARWELITAVCHLLWYTNSAINFYLYCLMGRRFRAQCSHLVTLQWLRKR